MIGISSIETLPHRLILLIGAPGSGKSSIAAQWQQFLPSFVISTDRIRAQLFGDEAVQGDWCRVWQQVQQQLQWGIAQLQTGQVSCVIYDATHARRQDRRRVIATARRLGFTQIDAVWLNPSLATCLQQNQQRSRQVPPAVIRRMYDQLRSSPPRLREGFDRIWCFDPVAIEPDLLSQQRFLSNEV